MFLKKKIFVVSISLIVGLTAATITAELWLRHKGETKWIMRDWTFNQADYSTRYIYWLKPLCDRVPFQCDKDIEHTVPFNVVTYPSGANNACMKFVFIGDSFTQAYGVHEDQAYPYVFARKFNLETGHCVSVFRLATGGSGSDQQFAFFSDVVEQIMPDYVFWQFYANDYYDNIQQALFTFNSSGKLVSLPTWRNSVYLGGLLHKHLPAVVLDSAVGNLISSFFDSRDLFGFYPANIMDINHVIKYNEQKVPKLIHAMEELSRRHGFQLFVTLAPLEIKMTGLGGEKEYVQSYMKTDSSLEQILLASSVYVPMRNINGETNVLGLSDENTMLFLPNEHELAIGGRHLSVRGNELFGLMLYENFVRRTEFQNNNL